MPEPYRQVLPVLNLSIERFTDDVPDDGGWYLLREAEVLGRYRSLKAAQSAWGQLITEIGWKPPERDIDPDDVRRREQKERWARNRGG